MARTRQCRVRPLERVVRPCRYSAARDECAVPLIWFLNSIIGICDLPSTNAPFVCENDHRLDSAFAPSQRPNEYTAAPIFWIE